MKFSLLLLLTAPTIFAEEPNKIGRQQFIICAACHGPDAQGAVTAPPLSGSEWVNGPPENLIRIQLRGLHGPITVKGVEHNIGTGMPSLAYQTDEQIAGVLTYVRSNFGNNAPPVAIEQVTALRSEAGKPQLEKSDLIPPPAVAPSKVVSTKYDNLGKESGLPGGLIAAIFFVVTVIAFFVFKTKNRPKP